MRLVVWSILLLLAAGVNAGIKARDFSSPEQRERYLHFTAELRCPKCQNQNLADSNAPIAEDLREQLYRLLQEGQSDQQIIDFMVSRYGEYVLYNPRIEPRTWALWGGPVLMFVGGLLAVGALVRRARQRSSAVADLSDEESTRLKQLLDQDRP